MNGRCTADPLDHADDICEFCGDEFCRSCLISTRGGKGQLVCRECAISNSGIKGSKSSKPRVSKARVERAREELEEAKQTRSAKSFQFFDEDDNYRAPEPVIATASAEEPSAGIVEPASKRRFALRRRTDDAVEQTVTVATPAPPEVEIEITTSDAPVSTPTGRSTPATTLIESGALAGTPPGMLPVSEVATETHDVAVPPPSLAAQVDHSVHDHGASQGQPRDVAPTTDPSAAGGTEPPRSTLADRLRARPVPPQAHVLPPVATPTPHQAHVPPPVATPAPPQAQIPPPVATPGPPPATSVSMTPPPMEPEFDAASLDVDPFAIEAGPAGSGPAPVDLSFPTPSTPDPLAAPAVSFEWQADSQAIEDQPTIDMQADPFADPFALATPFVASPEVEPETPAMPVSASPPRQRAADQFEAPNEQLPERRSNPTPATIVNRPRVPAPDAQRATPPPTPDVPEPVGVAAASPATAAGHVAAKATSADTDANGNWIPPLLRGMAPVAERRADQLPRRRPRD